MSNVFASATSHGSVTPSDTTVLYFRAIYVGVTGNVAIQLESTSAVTYVGVPAGTILPVGNPAVGGKVMSTGTTATSLVWMSW